MLILNTIQRQHIRLIKNIIKEIPFAIEFNIYLKVHSVNNVLRIKTQQAIPEIKKIRM